MQLKRPNPSRPSYLTQSSISKINIVLQKNFTINKTPRLQSLLWLVQQNTPLFLKTRMTLTTLLQRELSSPQNGVENSNTGMLNPNLAPKLS